MLKRFEQVLRRRALVSPGDRLLVAVSGGADSVALLYLLHQLAPDYPLSIVVAHLDHQLRSESVEDARFVAELCRRLDLPLALESVDVRALAESEKKGLEDAGRQARRRFLERTAGAHDCSAIVLAHHADDQAETVLFRLLRGSGLSGLAAMRMKSGGYVRPLLEFRAAELREYLQGSGIDWREDGSNVDPVYTRNRIRHQLMPDLAGYNPKIVEALNRLARQAADEEAFWSVKADAFLAAHGERSGQQYVLPTHALADCSSAERRRFLRSFLAQVRGGLDRIEAGHIDQVDGLLEAERPQADLDLPGIWVGRRYDRLLCGEERPAIDDYAIEIAGPGEYALPGGYRISFSIESGGAEETNVALFSGDEISFPLQVRSPRPGDRFQPSGMTGSKRLKDYFVDAKISREQRQLTPVVCCHDEIIWLAGRRRCGGHLPSPDKKLLKIVLLTPKQVVE